MNFLRLLPAIISFLLVGAHFSRDGQAFLMPIAFLFPFLLFIKKAWIPKLVQIGLWLASIEWLRSMFEYIQTYDAMGKPWTRLAIILSSVALFTALSSLVFRWKSLKKRYA